MFVLKNRKCDLIAGDFDFHLGPQTPLRFPGRMTFVVVR